MNWRAIARARIEAAEMTARIAGLKFHRERAARVAAERAAIHAAETSIKIADEVRATVKELRRTAEVVFFNSKKEE